jgi:hypothetical protein
MPGGGADDMAESGGGSGDDVAERGGERGVVGWPRADLGRTIRRE